MRQQQYLLLALVASMIIISPASAQVSPVADAGGPYGIGLGEALFLDGTGSYDLDATEFGDFISEAEWDLDGDGIYDYSFLNHTATTQLTLMVPAIDLAGFGLGQSVGETFQVTLRVTDSLGLSDTDYAMVEVIPEPATLGLLLLGGLVILRPKRST